MSFKKVFNKKAVIGLSLVALVGAGAAYGIKSKASGTSEEVHATGYEAASEEDLAWFDNNGVVVKSASDYYDLVEDGELQPVYDDKDAEVKAEKDSEYASELPSSVDNSQSKYFPPITTQGSVGSCCSFANVYYQFTYMFNKENDIPSQGNDNIYSPMWSYTQCGGNEIAIARLLKEKGAPAISYVPLVIDDDLYQSGKEDLFNKYGEETIQREATYHRITGTYSIENSYDLVDSPEAERLQPIKAALSNGEVLSFTTLVNNYNFTEYEIKYDKNDDNYKNTSNKKHKNDMICCRCDRNGGGLHRMTLVGYDDNIWVDINKNGVKETGEMGAFKIANSWGKNWCNDGFMWVSYDAMNYTSSVTENSAITLKGSSAPFTDIMGYIMGDYQSDIYAEYTLDMDKDNYDVAMSLTASNGEEEFTYDIMKHDTLIYRDGKDKYGTFLLPLDNVIADIDSENVFNYEWRLTANNLMDDSELRVSDVKLVYDYYKGVKEYKSKLDGTVTVNGEYKDIDINMVNVENPDSTVIYYKGYENPNIHYCIDGGNWTDVPGYPMPQTAEKAGYTHKAVLDLGNAKGVTVCFNDGNNNWDSRNGQNYRFEKGVYTYSNGNVNRIGDVVYKGKLDATLKTDHYGALRIGESITLSAKAFGNKNDVSYRFGYIDTETKQETIIADYSSKDNASVSFNKAGKYHLFVDVNDNGNVIRKYNYFFNVAAPDVNNLRTDSYYPQRKGTTITVLSNTLFVPVGGEAQLIIRDQNGNEKKVDTFNNGSAKWTPDEIGKFDIIERIVFDNNVLAEQMMTGYKILTDDTSFKILDIEINNKDVAKGEYVYAYMDFDGGTAPYSYEFGYIKDGNKVVIKSTDDASYSSVYFYVPDMTGKVTLYCDAKDASGAKAYKETQINVHPFKIKGMTVEPEGRLYAGETATIKVSTEYERSYKFPNTRKFTITNNKTGETENISSYLSEVKWTPAKAGEYTIQCDITSYMSGSDSYTMKYKVYEKKSDDFYIDAIVPSIASPAKVGDSIYFDIYTVNEIEDPENHVIYYVDKRNSTELETFTEYRFKEDSERFIWTPKSAGTYDFTVDYFANGIEYEESFEYVVEEPANENTITVYYKGFSTPYIHYSINGSWTNVPGLAMTPTAELAGFTHKAIIELPDGVTTIDACFNDGNNNWDSRNGMNYSFSLGEYSYSYGTIKKLGEQTDVTTIYYKGYEKPNIHYALNGSWTNVPGVSMEKTSEEAGFTHKIEIEMNDAASVTACFNDGNNHWDNNNGYNYVFGIGTYYFNNGKITYKK
ncbi:MAG: hypothetical protein K6G26_06590 [Lachnospiraceae bacterium]|nr:hypothetical protein [Lachnospiraceae bacterium]